MPLRCILTFIVFTQLFVDINASRSGIYFNLTILSRGRSQHVHSSFWFILVAGFFEVGETASVLCERTDLKWLRRQTVENSGLLVARTGIDCLIIITIKAYGRLIERLPYLSVLIILTSHTLINNLPLILLFQYREVLGPTFIEEVRSGIFVHDLLLIVVDYCVWRKL